MGYPRACGCQHPVILKSHDIWRWLPPPIQIIPLIFSFFSGCAPFRKNHHPVRGDKVRFLRRSCLLDTKFLHNEVNDSLKFYDLCNTNLLSLLEARDLLLVKWLQVNKTKLGHGNAIYGNELAFNGYKIVIGTSSIFLLIRPTCFTAPMDFRRYLVNSFMALPLDGLVKMVIAQSIFGECASLVSNNFYVQPICCR